MKFKQCKYSTINQRDQPTESTNIKWTHRERQQSTQLRSLSLPRYGHNGAYTPEDTNLDPASSTIRLRLISFAAYSITSPSTSQPSLPTAPLTTIRSCAVVLYNNSSSTPRLRLVSFSKRRSRFDDESVSLKRRRRILSSTPRRQRSWMSGMHHDTRRVELMVWGWCWKGTHYYHLLTRTKAKLEELLLTMTWMWKILFRRQRSWRRRNCNSHHWLVCW